MNRNQAKDLFRKDKDAYGKPKGIMGKIDHIFDELENQDIFIIKHVNCSVGKSDILGYTTDENIAKEMQNVSCVYEKVGRIKTD